MNYLNVESFMRITRCFCTLALDLGTCFLFFFFIFILEEETGIRKWCRLIIDIINDVLLDKKERENVFSLSNCDEKKKVVYIKSGEIGLRDFSQERIPAHMLTCSSCYSV